MKYLMCVPNISEGKDRALVEEIAGEIRGVSGVKLLNH
ncbi:MAG: glutamate formiminotransferase, partial [Deltaproteobacteria bacterium]|nr:glutamate formiminotransferase [Deltaproteobacteria bacterium]